MKKNSSEQEKIAQELLDRLVEQELNNNIKKWNAESDAAKPFRLNFSH